MFTGPHFIWLGICAVLIALLVFLSIKFKFSFKTATYIMSGVSIASELTKIFSHMFPATRFLGEGKTVSGFEGAMYLLPKSLPFHLCSILIFAFFYMALSKNERMIEKVKSFVVPICLIGGFLALILATSGVDFKDPSSYQSFIYHACILWYGSYLIYSKQVEMGLKIWLRNSVILFALVIIELWINSALCQFEVNFFFLVAPPAKGLPLLNLNHGWYAYFAHLIFTGLLATFLVNLPWIIKKEKAHK